MNIVRLVFTISGPAVSLLWCLWMRRKRRQKSTDGSGDQVEMEQMDPQPDYENLRGTSEAPEQEEHSRP
ncbi:unnamed protein product [Tetraodon nigroviridis]|nr:unnamed protein product [Tetraodon nigroviridis]